LAYSTADTTEISSDVGVAYCTRAGHVPALALRMI
jgi:hypothetical protein